MKPTIPVTLRGGLASSTASLLCQELGYLRLLRKGHLCSAITKITTAPSVPTRGYTPMGPPHLPANHGQSAPPQLQHRKQHHQPTTTTATSRDGSPDAMPSRRVWRQWHRHRTSTKEWVFTLESRAARTWLPSMVPSTGRATPQGHRHHCHRQWRLTPGTSPLPPTWDQTSFAQTWNRKTFSVPYPFQNIVGACLEGSGSAPRAGETVLPNVFLKWLHLHQKSLSTRGAGARYVLGGAEALPNRPWVYSDFSKTPYHII
jgi:hypothetical protein